MRACVRPKSAQTQFGWSVAEECRIALARRGLVFSGSFGGLVFAFFGSGFPCFHLSDRIQPAFQSSHIGIQTAPCGIASALIGRHFVTVQFLFPCCQFLFGQFYLSFDTFAVHVRLPAGLSAKSEIHLSAGGGSKPRILTIHLQFFNVKTPESGDSRFTMACLSHGSRFATIT